MDAFRPSIRLLAAGVHTIELKRGTTLKLEHGAGATMRLAYGSAWLSTGRCTRHVRAGDTIPVSNSGSTLIYALEDASLRLASPELCRMERRRRGEVAPLTSPQSDLLCSSSQELITANDAVGTRIGNVKRYLVAALLRQHAKNRLR